MTVTALPKGHPDADPVWEVRDDAGVLLGLIWNTGPGIYRASGAQRNTLPAWVTAARYDSVATARMVFDAAVPTVADPPEAPCPQEMVMMARYRDAEADALSLAWDRGLIL